MSQMKYMDAIRIALEEEMERDPNVILYGEDVELGYVFQVTQGIINKLGPDRVRDTPISENVIVGSGVGAALGELDLFPKFKWRISWLWLWISWQIRPQSFVIGFLVQLADGSGRSFTAPQRLRDVLHPAHGDTRQIHLNEGLLHAALPAALSLADGSLEGHA